jgi:hypothetical protein
LTAASESSPTAGTRVVNVGGCFSAMGFQAEKKVGVGILIANAILHSINEILIFQLHILKPLVFEHS